MAAMAILTTGGSGCSSGVVSSGGGEDGENGLHCGRKREREGDFFFQY